MRLRLTFAKQGALRYTGHLDVQRIWERTVRRAGLPLAYTHGFRPRPKIQLASALPLGFASRAEIVDVWLEEDLSPDEALRARLQENAPPGLEILRLERVDDRAPALQNQLRAAEYEVTLLDAPPEPELDRRVRAVLEAGSLPRTRRGKTYDLRPLIESLRLLPPDAQGRPRLAMRLAAREGATGRPDEVLAALSIPLHAARVERVGLIFEPQINTEEHG